jgi:hypothetical protein
MKVRRGSPETWADDAYIIEVDGFDRQMLLGSLQRAIRHHEHKRDTLKRPGDIKRHAKTAEHLSGMFNELRMEA